MYLNYDACAFYAFELMPEEADAVCPRSASTIYAIITKLRANAHTHTSRRDSLMCDKTREFRVCGMFGNAK